MSNKLLLALFSVVLASGARGQSIPFSPPSGLFTCDLPSAEWTAFEEEEARGTAVHLLGPDNPSGSYRTGIDIHRADPLRPGFIPMKEALSRLRRDGGPTGRVVTPIKRVKVGPGLARVFQVKETRRVPLDLSPSIEETLHHYVAVIEDGSDYFVIRLSSSEDVYLDFRDTFLAFLNSFRPGASH